MLVYSRLYYGVYSYITAWICLRYSCGLHQRERLTKGVLNYNLVVRMLQANTYIHCDAAFHQCVLVRECCQKMFYNGVYLCAVFDVIAQCVTVIIQTASVLVSGGLYP